MPKPKLDKSKYSKAGKEQHPVKVVSTKRPVTKPPAKDKAVLSSLRCTPKELGKRVAVGSLPGGARETLALLEEPRMPAVFCSAAEVPPVPSVFSLIHCKLTFYLTCELVIPGLCGLASSEC